MNQENRINKDDFWHLLLPIPKKPKFAKEEFYGLCKKEFP